MANLLDISAMPDIQDNILKHLGVREVKALRLTCRETCDWVDNSSVKRHWGGVSATIDLSQENDEESGLGFESLAALPFVVSELRLLNNTSPYLLNFLETGEFLRVKGDGVKTIRMDVFFGCRFEDEVHFFEGLSGLEELFVDKLRVDLKFTPFEMNPHRFPAAILNLRTLDIKVHFFYRANFTKLREVVCAPRFTTTLKLPLDQNLNPVIHLYQILQSLQQRRALVDVAKTNYTNVDLAELQTSYFVDSPLSELAMRLFLEDCYLNSVRLLNVNPLLLVAYNSFSRRTSFIEGTVETVESILGWHWALQGFQSLTLKELRIPSTGRSQERSLVPVNNIVAETYSWPNLRLLHVNFEMDCHSVEDQICCFQIVSALHLGSICRPHSGFNTSGLNVTDMKLTFPRSDETDEPMAPCGIVFPFSIVTHYPNVKILKVIGWDAEDAAWVELWNGLRHLEEVHIADCRKLGDKGFLSDCSTEQSPFLKLKNLKKLTLKLNNMSGISDRLFRDVIAHLPLEEFYLHTGKTLSSRELSRQALEYLADGTFGRSVKKFPFDNIALKDTTDEELQKLKLRFPQAYF